MKNNIKVDIIAIISIIVMILGVVVWNKIIEWQNKDDSEEEVVDTSEANNVSTIDSKLGEDVRITQSYLLNYTTKKIGTWYESSAYVKKITKEDDLAILTIASSKDSDNEIKATIKKDKCKVSKGDTIYFVGTIDLETGYIKLVKLELEEIGYSSVTKMEIDDLINNIKLLKSTYFIISGYMVTDNDEYKLFDSKDSYKSDATAGNYFLISWDGEFEYTGNQDVKIKCLLGSTYKLKDCTLED